MDTGMVEQMIFQDVKYLNPQYFHSWPSRLFNHICKMVFAHIQIYSRRI